MKSLIFVEFENKKFADVFATTDLGAVFNRSNETTFEVDFDNTDCSGCDDCVAQVTCAMWERGYALNADYSMYVAS